MSATTSPISVGVVGAGAVVSGVHLPVLKSMRDEVRVDYVADVSEGSVGRVGAAYQCRSVVLTDDVQQLPVTDVVLIATPVGVRLPYYELFATRGTAVFAEKPAVPTMSALSHLKAHYQPERFAVGFQRRTYASSFLVSRLISNGMLGTLRSIEVQEGALTTSTGGAQSFMTDMSLSGGGILMDLGCHGIDLACRLSRAEGSSTTSVEGVLDREVDREIGLAAKLDCMDGPVALHVSLSWLGSRPGTARFEFEHGSALVGAKPGSPVELLTVDGDSMGVFDPPPGPPLGANTVHQACYLVWRSFLDGLSGKSAPELTLESISPAVRLIEDAYADLRSRA